MAQKRDIRRDTEMIFADITSTQFTCNMAKWWRGCVYPYILRSVLDMRRYCYGAFGERNLTERAVLIDKYIASLEDLRGLVRRTHEVAFLKHTQMDMLDKKFCEVREQAVKWKSYTNSQT